VLTETFSELKKEMKDHMETVKNTKTTGFTAEVLEIYINKKGANNAVIYDLPGLRAGQKELGSGTGADEEAILGIVAKYARDPEFIPIIVVKASESPQTLTDLQTVSLSSF
jgi:hypothetical protein